MGEEIIIRIPSSNSTLAKLTLVTMENGWEEADEFDKIARRRPDIVDVAIKKGLFSIVRILLARGFLPIDPTRAIIRSLMNKNSIVFTKLIKECGPKLAESDVTAIVVESSRIGNNYVVEKMLSFLHTKAAKIETCNSLVEHYYAIYDRDWFGPKDKLLLSYMHDSIALSIRSGGEIDNKRLLSESGRDLFGHWRSLLPKWTPENNRLYPLKFQTTVLRLVMCLWKSPKLQEKNLGIMIVAELADVYRDSAI